MRYPAAEWRPSPNRSRRHVPVTLICLHQTDGQPDVDRAVASHLDPDNDKSAHFFVGRGGEVVQLVDTDEVAWHDSGRNGHSIGIEHVARQPGEFKNWADLPESRRARLLPEGGDVNAATDPGMALTDAQLRASAKLVAWLLLEHRLGIEAVVPHCSNPRSTHVHCGQDVADGGIWPWEKYRRLVNDTLAAETVQGPTG